MTQYLISDTTLTDIADAIRTKKGTSALIDPADMAAEIASISGTIPEETLVSEFDFVNSYSTGAIYNYDKIRNISTATNNYGGMTNTADGCVITSRNGRIKTQYLPPSGIPVKVVIEFGEFNKTYDYTTEDQHCLFSFDNKNPANYAMIMFKYNSGDSYYWLRDQTGNNQRIEESDPYYFENKKVIAVFNGAFRNGKIYRYIDNNGTVTDYNNYWSLYLEDGTVLNEYALALGYDSNDVLPMITIGSPTYSFQGAVFKDVKVYQINQLNTYQET